MPSVVEAELVPWGPGIPGIWYRYEDGVQGCSDARQGGADIEDAIRLLPIEQRARLRDQIDAAARSR